jgi:hypothetical protein
MLHHLGEMMRGDREVSNRQTALDEMKNDFGVLKKLISRTDLEPASESSTGKVTSSIIDSLLCGVIGTGLGIRLKARPQKGGTTVKEAHVIPDWRVIQGSKVAVCWEDKSENVFNKWIGGIIDLAKSRKQYPENYWDGTITNSPDSIMGKVRSTP